MGAKIKNQDYNYQAKQERKKRKEKCNRTTLQLRRVCKKKELTSSNDCLHPSKHLAFLSLLIYHIKQCGTSLQKSILQCRLQFTLPRLKQLNYLKRHNSLKSKQTQRQGPHLKSYRAMKQKMIHQLFTPLIHVTSIKNNNTLFAKDISCKNLSKEVDHEMKAILGGTSNCHTNLQGKEQVGG